MAQSGRDYLQRKLDLQARCRVPQRLHRPFRSWVARDIVFSGGKAEGQRMARFEYDGASIYYEETGSGEPVLFMPGFTESIARHAKLRETLSATYRVIAADLPGSGQSKPQPHDYTPDYWRDDAHAFAALVDVVVGAPVHVLGFSDGGEVALLLAAHHPALVKSVLAWGAVGFAAESGRDMVGSFFNVIDRPAPGWEDYRTHLIDYYGLDLARAITQGFARNALTLIDRGGDISRSLAGTVVCPLLLIVGEQDTANPSALAKEYAKAARAGTAITVPGAGHEVHVSHRDWFERTVSEWLAVPR
jgi:valacyclovir hydrolase